MDVLVPILRAAGDASGHSAAAISVLAQDGGCVARNDTKNEQLNACAMIRVSVHAWRCDGKDVSLLSAPAAYVKRVAATALYFLTNNGACRFRGKFASRLIRVPRRN